MYASTLRPRMVGTLSYAPMVDCTYTFESKGHCCITKCVEQINERCIDLIFNLARDMLVS
jgi:hypothetical protein